MERPEQADPSLLYDRPMDALAAIEQHETILLDWDTRIVDVKVRVVVGVEEDETDLVLTRHGRTIAILQDGIGVGLGGCDQAGHGRDDVAVVHVHVAVAVIVEKVRTGGGRGPYLANERRPKRDLTSGLARMMMGRRLVGLGVDQDLVHR